MWIRKSDFVFLQFVKFIFWHQNSNYQSFDKNWIFFRQKKDLEKREELMNSSTAATSVEDISKIKTAWKSNSRCSTAKLELPTSSNSTHSRQKAIAVLVSISERPNLHFVGSAEPMPNHDLSGRTDAEPMPNLNQ